LFDFPFYVSDEEKAKKVIADEIEQAKLDNDAKTALKARMYYPLTVEDCFLNEEVNNFPYRGYRTTNYLFTGRNMQMEKDYNM